MTPSRQRIGTVLACMVILLWGWFAWTYWFLPKDTSTILWHAKKAFDQCSRARPDPGDAFWLPTAGQVRDAEAALPAMLAARRKLGLRMPQKADGGVPFRFHRQYIGFLIQGERVMYLNAYPLYYNESLNDEWDGSPYSPFEQPQIRCDGGRFFWGAVYRPNTKTFEQFETNGAGSTDGPE